MANFETVKQYVLQLGHEITEESAEDELLVIHAADKGIVNMILDCEDEVLVIEQVICPLPAGVQPEHFKRILQCNRTLVHGAFVVDDQGAYLLFRDTLQLENLDLPELEASINALSLGLAENYHIILDLAGVDTNSLAINN